MSEENSHTPVSVTDVKGRQTSIFRRSNDTVLQAEKRRLGMYFDIPPLKGIEGLDTLDAFSTDPNLKDKPLLLFTNSMRQAQRAFSYRMRRDRRPFRSFTGTQLMGAYLDSEERDYFNAWKGIPLIFITFSYGESPNKRLADVLVETLSTRKYSNKHIWVAMSADLVVMQARWGDALAQLKCENRIRIPEDPNEVPSIMSGFDISNTNITSSVQLPSKPAVPPQFHTEHQNVPPDPPAAPLVTSMDSVVQDENPPPIQTKTQIFDENSISNRFAKKPDKNKRRKWK